VTALDQHFIDIGACDEGRAWVAANCTTAADCWQKLLEEKRFDWALWWYSTERGPALESMLHRWALRAARVHAANACQKAGLTDHAATLRALPDNATLEQIRSASAAARAASDAASDARAAASAASDAARAAAWAAAWAASAASDAARAAAWAAAWAAACDAAWDARAARDAARDAERDQQLADLRELCTSPWGCAGIDGGAK
jgi:hypothetical protein